MGNGDTHVSMDGEVQWDPYDIAYLDDPYPTFNRIREEKPLYYNEKYNFYALSRFADLERGLPDWRTFPSSRGNILEFIKSGAPIPPGTVIFEDPPQHDLHRGLLARAFTPKRMRALEPQIREFCARSLDPHVGSGRFDLISALGEQLPVRVIGMLLGIPEADQEAIRAETDELMSTEDGEAVDFRGGAILSNEAFAEYIDWRLTHPSDDLMTELLTTEFEDEHGVRRTLTRNEVLTYVTVVAGAGGETTGRLIGWIGATLANHPDQRRDLAANYSLIPNAIEELLRFEPIGAAAARYVAKDVEFHGQTVPAGNAMMFIMAGANRDPRHYPDGDRFDIHRPVRQHLTFGFGLHYCLGAALARIEGRIAMEELLTRFPKWDVDWDDARLAKTTTTRGWGTLPLLVG